MRLLLRLTLIAFVAVSLASAAEEKVDFSGSYVLSGGKGSFQFKKGMDWTLNVAQTENTIEVTRIIDGKQNKNIFNMDGSEGAYTSSGGVEGICKAQWKGKTLILEVLVTSLPQNNRPAVQIHTKQRWELSSDSRTLTVRTDVDFPGSPLGDFQVIEPWSEIYTRK
jgi:hypothetical protein